MCAKDREGERERGNTFNYVPILIFSKEEIFKIKTFNEVEIWQKKKKSQNREVTLDGLN